MPRTVAHFVTAFKHSAANFFFFQKNALPSQLGFTFLHCVSSYRCDFALDHFSILPQISEDPSLKSRIWLLAGYSAASAVEEEEPHHGVVVTKTGRKA